MKITITKDLLAGAIFTLLGILAVWYSQRYPLGTAARMGAGYFPTLVGGAIAVLGLVLTIRSEVRPDLDARINGTDYIVEIRPLLFILAGIAVFALLIDAYGLIAAIILLTIIARAAGRGGGVVELAIMSIVLCVIAVVVFVYGLGVSFKLGPW